MKMGMPSLSRVTALLLAFVTWLWSAGVLLAGLVWGAGLRCDDACDGQGWRRSEDAWQWDGVVVLGGAAFLAGTALILYVWRRKRLYAAGAFIAGLSATLGLATALSPEWAQHLDRVNAGEALLFVVGLCAPVVAVLLAGATTRPTT
jgi:hypothetical protein